MTNHPEIHNQTMAGFKVGMAEPGYAGNKDVRFIYNFPTTQFAITHGSSRVD